MIQNNNDIEEEIIEAPKHIDQKRKRQIKHLIISFGLLLIVGVSLCFLVPYLKTLSGFHQLFTPTMIVKVLIEPLFWVLCGWTLFEVFDVLGIIEIRHSKLSKWIFISALALVLLYLAIMLPFIIESIRSMILELQYSKNPDAYPNGFSYSYQLPVFLQRMERNIFSINNKSVIFTILGVVLRICMPEKQN